jgi:hypothetical protein
LYNGWYGDDHHERSYPEFLFILGDVVVKNGQIDPLEGLSRCEPQRAQLSLKESVNRFSDRGQWPGEGVTGVTKSQGLGPQQV